MYLVEEKSFFSHLEELRFLFIKIGVCLLCLLPLSFWLAEPLVRILIQSCTPDGFTLKYFSPMEPFIVRMKASLILALFFGMPYIAYQVWKFAAPGLYRHERFWLSRLALTSWSLFVAGVFFCYYVIIPSVMHFALKLQNDVLEPAIGIGNFVGLVGMLLVGFGIMFQFPIVVYVTARAGMVRLQTLKKQRPLVLIVILAMSALLTPPDIISQLLMSLPTYLLFECSLLFAALAVKEQQKSSPAETTEVVSADTESSLSTDKSDSAYRRVYHSKRRKLRAIKRK